MRKTYSAIWKSSDPKQNMTRHEYAAPAKLYRGYKIFKYSRVEWDVVQDGVILCMLAGPNGARRWIDKLCDKQGEPQ